MLHRQSFVVNVKSKYKISLLLEWIIYKFRILYSIRYNYIFLVQFKIRLYCLNVLTFYGRYSVQNPLKWSLSLFILAVYIVYGNKTSSVLIVLKFYLFSRKFSGLSDGRGNTNNLFVRLFLIPTKIH